MEEKQTQQLLILNEFDGGGGVGGGGDGGGPRGVTDLRFCVPCPPSSAASLALHHIIQRRQVIRITRKSSHRCASLTCIT